LHDTPQPGLRKAWRLRSKRVQKATILTITGKAKNAAEKDLAIKYVNDVNGVKSVKSVKNQMTIE
jgi:osmotically-inducible protein OsmY